MISPVPEIKGIPHKDVFGQLYLLDRPPISACRAFGAPKIGETLVVSAQPTRAASPASSARRSAARLSVSRVKRNVRR